MKHDRRFIPVRTLSGLCATILLGGCSFAPNGGKSRGDHAFISYWPPPKNSGRLRLAVKDLIDMKGYKTTAGSEYIGKNTTPATRDASCLAIARERGVDFVGKTNLTELAISTSGRNNYFGTPVNRWDGKHHFTPGGSSSGSAMAVADGRADVAIGTDTGGSIRLPAACCGVYGLKTTFGLVPLKGVFPISRKHLDTIGPMAADVPRLVQGMDLLERGFDAKYRAAVAAKPSARQIRVGRLYIGNTDPAIDKAIDAALAAQGFKVVRLDDNFRSKWTQADADGKSVALGDAYRTDGKFLDKPGIDSTTRTIILKGGVDSALDYDAAVARQKAWQRDLRRVFKRVDLIATPVLRTVPLRFPFFGSEVAFEYLVFSSQNTVAVNFSGNPALAIPLDMPRVGKEKFTPVTSLQLVGPRNGEAQLLNAARILARKG